MIDVSFRGEAAPTHRSCDVCLEDLMMVETQPELCDFGELAMHDCYDLQDGISPLGDLFVSFDLSPSFYISGGQ